MNFLPSLYILKNSRTQNIYHLDLYHSDKPINQLPVIAFESMEAEENTLVRDIDTIPLKGSELVRNAFTNLRGLQSQWQEDTTDDSHVIYLSDEKFASEKILDKDFLKEAHKLLGADKIMVGIPCKGDIYACRFDSESSRAKLLSIIETQYNDFSKNQISSNAFIIEDSIIVDVVVNKIEQKSNRLQVESSETFEYKVVKMNLFQEIHSVKIFVDGKDMGEVTAALFKILHNTLIDYGSKKGFNGNINIHAAEHSPKKTADNVKLLGAFYDRIKTNPSILKLKSEATEKINIIFQFGTDFNAGAADNKYTLNL